MFGIIASMIDGVLIGSIYGLAAMGLTLIWGVMDVINLAHGAMITVGMFSLYIVFSLIGLNPYVALVPIALGGFILGFVMYWLAVHRVIGRAPLMSLLATFAVNMVAIGLGTAVWSTSPYNVRFSLPGFHWHSHVLTGTHLVAAALAIAIAGSLYFFLYGTRPGRAIRAVAANREAAELMGIPSVRVVALTFGLGIAIAVTAGGLIATLFPFTVLSGSNYELTSFVVAVLGGLGNPVGALVGGVLLGLLEGTITPFIQVSWFPVVEFAVFVLILIAFPQGILGTRAPK